MKLEIKSIDRESIWSLFALILLSIIIGSAISGFASLPTIYEVDKCVLFLYFLIAIFFFVLQGFYAFEYHGVVNLDKNGVKKSSLTYQYNRNNSIWLFGQYFLNMFGSALGWISGYFLIFTNLGEKLVKNDSELALFALIAVAILGITGYLPYMIVNRLSPK